MNGHLEGDWSYFASWHRNLREAVFSATQVFEPENYSQISMDWPDARFIGYLHCLQTTHDLIQTMPALGYEIAIDGFTGRVDQFPT
eukprot:4125653-Heterocapsa_arctica.AAC.1